MSNLNHTPGPWTHDDADGETLVYPEGRLCHYVAELPRQDSDPDGDYPDDETRAANAYLISAAPELLAALQRLSVLADSAGHPFMKTVAQEAIAKATGGDDE